MRGLFASATPDYLISMPELPEVEVLVRHLAPLLRRRTIHAVEVHRPRVLRPTTTRTLKTFLRGASLAGLRRRGKYLLFEIRRPGGNPITVVGHLGMTGRMYLLPRGQALPKHTAVALDLGKEQFVFEDTRFFGRFTLDTSVLDQLGPEPLSAKFTAERFAAALTRSAQPIKVKLLDQSLVAGIGNIYASEALFRARLSPRLPARRLKPELVTRLWSAIRATLTEAIAFGSTVALNYSGNGERDGLFYYGAVPDTSQNYLERLRVYRPRKPTLLQLRDPDKTDRAGRPEHVLLSLLPELSSKIER